MEPLILFQDKWIIVCKKPAGVLSENGGMPEKLRDECGAERIYCVHRLDRDVSGVMVYAKDGKTAAALSSAMAERRVQKEYIAVVQGTPESASGLYRDLLFRDRTKNKTYVVKRMRRGVRDAELEYEVLDSAKTEKGELSLLRISLHTGRTHQIRVQFASRKMPLVGDARYGSDFREGGIALMSRRLAFTHPVTGKSVDISLQPDAVWPWNCFVK